MTNEEFIGKMGMIYVGDRNALEDCTQEYLRLKKQAEKQKEVINKAIEYVSNKKAIINTDVIRIFDLFEINEQGYTDELLDILKEVE